MANKSNQVDMTKGPLLTKIIAFAIPLMLTSMLQLLYNAADVLVVGKFAGDASLAAVGSTGALISLIVNVFVGLSLGTGVVLSQAIGAKNNKRCHRIVHTSVLLSLFLGFLVGVLGFGLCKPLLVLMSTPADVLNKATLYMKIYFLGMPGFMVYNFGAAILRSAGDTKRPLVVLAVSGLVNVVFNVIFVAVFNMDVAGVATATIISQYISAVWVVMILVKEDADYKLEISKLRIYKNELSCIISYGLPTGIQSGFFSVSNVIIQSSINSFGMLIVAGNSAASSLESFVYTASNSIAQTAMTFAGQNSGAGDYKRVKKVLVECSLLCLGVGIVAGAILILFRTPLLSLYTDSLEVIKAGSVRINIICMFYILCGVMDTVANVSRGMGKSIVPMFITLVFVCLVRVVWIFTVFRVMNTVECIYWSYPITWALTAAVQFIYFRSVYKTKLHNTNISAYN